MRKVLLLLFVFTAVSNANAQLSQSELNQLDQTQLNIYTNQSKEIAEKIKQLEYDLFKAEDMIRMGKEMQTEAKQAGAVYVIRGMNLKEATLKSMEEAKKSQRLLDNAAREAIKNNQKKKQEEAKKANNKG